MFLLKDYNSKYLRDCLRVFKERGRDSGEAKRFENRLNLAFKSKDNLTKLVFDSQGLVAVVFVWGLTKDCLNSSVFLKKDFESKELADFIVRKLKRTAEQSNKEKIFLSIDSDYEQLINDLKRNHAGVRVSSEHWVMEKNLESFDNQKPSLEELELVKVNEESLRECINFYKRNNVGEVRLDDLSKEVLRKRIKNFSNYYFVLKNKENEKITGLIDYSINGKTVSVNNILVSPENRGKGLASKMIKLVLLDCKSRGIRKAVLGVNSLNKPAVKLYEKLGFKKTATSSIKFGITS